MYMLIYNEKLHNIIQTVTSKAVLILDRFTEERKNVLDALRVELRKKDLIPIIFDFENPSTKNITETVSTIAKLARFVIADITDAKSIPQELREIVPGNPSLPIQPIILSTQYEYSMFKDFMDYPWVLKPYRYDNLIMLLESLDEHVITPAIGKAEEIQERRDAFDKEMQE